MPPGSTSGNAPPTGGRALRIHERGPGIVVRRVPVQAPLVNIVSHVEKTVGIGGFLTHGPRTSPPSLIAGDRFWVRVTPGVLRIAPPLGGLFPLGFGRKSIWLASHRRKPNAVRSRVEPVDPDDRQIGIGEGRVGPSAGLRVIRFGQEARVFGPLDLGPGNVERVVHDRMPGALGGVAVVRSHEKFPRGDPDEEGRRFRQRISNRSAKSDVRVVPTNSPSIAAEVTRTRRKPLRGEAFAAIQRAK